MTESLWLQLLRDLPTAGVVLIVGYTFLRYLDRWVDKVGSAQATQAQQRQQEIIVLLERTLAATQMVESKLAEVVERNTRALDATTVALTHVGELLAALMQAQESDSERMRNMERLMLDHERNVAARPCQQTTAKRGQPK